MTPDRTKTPLPRSGIRDNRARGCVGDFLREKIRDGATLSIVSAYFTIYAFDALKERLQAIERLDFLFGEPRFIRSLDPEEAEAKAFRIEDEGLQLANRLEQKRTARDCADWIREKVRIKSIRRRSLLHGKLYHIAHGGVEEAIVGSSNFTLSGLGLGAVSNIELNLEVDGNRDRGDLKAWFDELWRDETLVEDVTDEVLRRLEQLYADHAPAFIYYKTLFHLFEKHLADQDGDALLDARGQLIDTDIWKTLYAFQKDGVRGAIQKILTYNGCIIADSVGLGKTYEALAVIKYFELRNGKVLVLCPRKLRENWTVYQAQNNSELNPFVNDRFGYTVLSHTDLSRSGGKSGDVDLETLHWGNYDLVVIDESHNFRNNTRGRRDEDGRIITRSRYERLMDDIIRAGVPTRVLLLSATPVNTDLRDLRNQLNIITGGDDGAFRDAIRIPSVRETLANAQRRFHEWARSPATRDHGTAALLERLSSAFFTLLDALTIARSRNHVRTYYPDALAEVGAFPERHPPVSIFPDIDTQGLFPSYDRLNDEISRYRLSLFNPSRYLRPAFRARYAGRLVRHFTQEDREHYLIGMMKVNFLKRLESSVHSFEISMQRTIAKIEHLENRIHRFKQVAEEHPAFDPDEWTPEEDDEELQGVLEVGEKLRFDLAHLDVDAWLEDLREDKRQLHALYLSAKDVDVERDAKLGRLKELIAAKVRRPTRNARGEANRKVLVFTAFADTAAYLYDALAPWAADDLGIHGALVTGGRAGDATTFGGRGFTHILTNFSPVAKRRAAMPSMPQDGEIDLLIATDCISEGQNLQDCDYVINYDIHWNPVRLIQRFGRIDRIGSLNPSIRMVNFWPTEDLNKYINLRNRVEARMALADLTATSQDNILDEAELRGLAEDELNYRDRQLLRLKDEVLDLEALNETVTLSEFTLDDFRVELMAYLETDRRRLEEAPLGLYAVVAPDPDQRAAGPGVIFCLRQKGEASGNEAVNPLQPYFLVFVRDDGEVRYTFTQAKRILEVFRRLCAGKRVPDAALCALFDGRTDDGRDVRHYGALLDKAVEAIVKTFRRRHAAQLTGSRRARLTDAAGQITETTDFELVTWLVIAE